MITSVAPNTHHDHHQKIITEQDIQSRKQVENAKQNIHQREDSPFDISPSLKNDQTPCQCPLSPSYQLFNSPSLQLLTWHHHSYTSLKSSVTSLLNVSLSIFQTLCLSHRLTFVDAYSHLYHHLHDHLSQHKNIPHHITIQSSLRRMQ